MAEIDVSSFKSPELPNPLDVAGKLGNLQAQSQSIQRQGIGIESDKLKLMNERLGILGKEYTTLLADPDVVNGSPNAVQKVTAVGQRMVNLGAMPANMFGEFAKSIPTDPKQIPMWIKQQVARADSIGEAVSHFIGNPGLLNNNQSATPIITSPFNGMQATGQPIQLQPSPETQAIGPDGRPQMLGAQPPQLPEGGGAVAGPPNRLPVQNGSKPVPIVSFTNPVNKDQSQVVPRGGMTGQSPLFEEGKKKFDEDTQVANEKLTSIRPAIQAYKMLDGLRSGPGTDTWNKAIAFLKANNIIPTETKNDPTAIYQEVNKKLSQYVAGSATRSDADQALREASNPNVKTQIIPALKKLTRDAIALDRARALVPFAFEGNNFEKYVREHRGKFPTQISEDALTIDLLPENERKELAEEMFKKKNTFEGKKFWSTYQLVKKHNLVDTSGF